MCYLGDFGDVVCIYSNGLGNKKIWEKRNVWDFWILVDKVSVRVF